MTKITKFFDREKLRTKTPIELIKHLADDRGIDNMGIRDVYSSAKAYDNVCLLYRSKNHDVMMAWDEDNEPVIVMGHWNDGIVE